ncbi:MAG: 4-(cytidine 5'-diphospho)-2-C-methyl-D-erythritol kinase [Parcubacteria group bacterium]|jgi:4-diphosphocytidyl-2-C-methyl-D-erythritol kinase
MKTYHYQSHAKVNLTLEIIEKLPNGYHKLRTVMMQLPHLFDDVDVVFLDDRDDIVIRCNDSAVPTDEKNICHKVAKKYFDRTKKHVGMNIVLNKRIPAAAGMGGGSSNGAYVLLALNDYFDKVLSQEELIDVAASVGKDIPFFFVGSGCALIKGMGEIIAEELVPPHEYFLVVNPQIAVSTPWAFCELAKHLWFMADPERRDRSREMAHVIRSGENIASHLYNDFEIAVFATHPVIAEVKQTLIAYGATGALMSGSGSTVFGIFETETELHRAKEKIQKHYPQFFVAEG